MTKINVVMPRPRRVSKAWAILAVASLFSVGQICYYYGKLATPCDTMTDSPDGRQARATKPSATTSASKCPSAVEVPDSLHKSQSGEDRKLMGWFAGLCGGTYIEMGGLDGVRYSNSFAFSMGLSWRGVLVELVRESYEQLARNRPDEIATVHAGVCAIPQELHYYFHERGGKAVSAIYEFSTPSFREKWWGNVSMDDPGVGRIECDTLDALLRKHAPGHAFFDFFSLDVEGAELSVLESVDFDRVGFGIVFVEADEHNQMKNQAIRNFLESKNYTFLFEYERSYWFANPNFYDIYKHLMY